RGRGRDRPPARPPLDRAVGERLLRVAARPRQPDPRLCRRAGSRPRARPRARRLLLAPRRRGRRAPGLARAATPPPARRTPARDGRAARAGVAPVILDCGFWIREAWETDREALHKKPPRKDQSAASPRRPAAPAPIQNPKSKIRNGDGSSRAAQS